MRHCWEKMMFIMVVDPSHQRVHKVTPNVVVEIGVVQALDFTIVFVRVNITHNNDLIHIMRWEKPSTCKIRESQKVEIRDPESSTIQLHNNIVTKDRHLIPFHSHSSW